jgi:phosphoglycolate phosphatase-like HAD superfamily hydrolase
LFFSLGPGNAWRLLWGSGSVDGELLFACHCGPGNALIDDRVSARCDVPLDDGGEIAPAGSIEANHIAWGIVTNKPGWLTEPLLEKLNLRQRAGVVVSGDTLLARKPDPAPLLHAATELGLSPAECIYIGDAERDVLAARAAGMRVYVAMFGYIPAQERPREWPATGWLEGPEAVAQLIDALPPRN